MLISFGKLVSSSIRYHYRMHLAVAFGVAAATAVITGALLVGDSVRGSLRQLTLDRLGRIDEILASDRLFREEIPSELNSDASFTQYYREAIGIMLFPQVTVESRREDQIGRASEVLLIGCEASYWNLGSKPPPHPLPGRGEIVLNEPLAEELGVNVGDEVTVRLPKASQVPADSPLAQKSDRISSLAGLKVISIFPAEGLGRFHLRPSQRVPRNAFVATATLQEALAAEGKLNAILVAGKDQAHPPDEKASEQLAQSVRFSLEDFGVRVQRIQADFRSDESDRTESAFQYYSLSTDRMVFSRDTSELVQRALAEVTHQPVSTYLANLIGTSGKTNHRESVPYSTITAIDFGPAFPLRDELGHEIQPLNENEIVLNSWTAEQLEAKPGDPIIVRFFEPETTHGQTVERTAEFVLRAITPLVEPTKPFERSRRADYDQRPELANDPDLTPAVEGVTDQESMDNWDAPFPFNYDYVTKEDEAYWDRHRTTPKAFISLAAGQKLWGSRFGDVTSFRISAEGVDEASLQKKLVDEFSRSADKFGLAFLPVKRQQLAAARGSTPFDVLFLSLSFFVIAAGLMLVAILFRLGVERRATELGILGAVGIAPTTTGRLLVVEGAMVATLGAAVGVILGIGYAWLMLAGLRSWWIGAITTPFLQFHWSSMSLLGGWLAGILASLLTIVWSARQLRKIPAKLLLAGQTGESRWSVVKRSRWSRIATIIALVAAAVLATYATRAGGMAQAGSFVGSGALLLTAVVLQIWSFLRRPSQVSLDNISHWFSVRRLGIENAKRNPGRSTATVALVASASFLIVALSSFRLMPTERGSAGFNFVAQSTQPLYTDLNDEAERRELLANKAKLLEGTTVFSFRLRSGDDASCNNLYQATQPRVIGVPPAFAHHFEEPTTTGFAWAGSAAISDSERNNPWEILFRNRTTSGGDTPVPVVIDKNTAMYSLHLYRGIGEEFEVSYEPETVTRFQVVGLLENSILQGALLMAEADFNSLFPDVSGYRYFLIQAPAGKEAQVTNLLEDRLSDEGFDIASAPALLEQLLAVQNTYLSTFQSLGALGLLLGTFGLAAVQLRNVFERRRELAVLRATGFQPGRLVILVLWENLFLLTAGLACGIIAAVFAVLPHKFLGESSLPLSLLRDLAVMLSIVMVVGILTSTWASRSVLKMPLLASLRKE